MNELGPIREAVQRRLAELDEGRFVARLFERDVTCFGDVTARDAGIADKVRRRLGWLTSTDDLAGEVPEWTAFTEEVRQAGYRRVLLLGMGGSSLCPEVQAHVLGVAPGFLRLRVLDSTTPEAVRDADAWSQEERTLFLVASKSGGTKEVDSFYRHFRARCGGEDFVAITDPGSPLEARARAEGFRRVFLNPDDIGGRFSALSAFGLLPAALIGVDLEAWRASALAMTSACRERAAADNPGVLLGAVLDNSVHGRDKLTLALSPTLRPLGAWIEQLIAESTGKDGVGVLPIDGEPAEAVLGDDRLIVAVTLAGDDTAEVDALCARARAGGHPVLRTELASAHELAGEFYRWEVATAVCGALMGINPFDEPNVTESKTLTSELLAVYGAQRRLPLPEAGVTEAGIGLMADAALPLAGDGAACMAAHLDRARARDFVALLAYLPPRSQLVELLEELRAALSRRTGLPTTLGLGPRFLHSTGQYHKGGPDRGLFLQLVADSEHDLDIPGTGETFGTLVQAQALGDLKALERRGRRVLRAALPADVATALRTLRGWVE